jgi:hypothetical protein
VINVRPKACPSRTRSEGGLAGSRQRQVRQFTKPGEHRCRIPGVDLADPLGRDAIRRVVAVGPVVEHQLPTRRTERAEGRTVAGRSRPQRGPVL